MQNFNNLTIKNSSNLKINLNLYLPKTSIFSFNKKYPLVVFCHGFMGSKDHSFFSDLAQDLVKHNFAVVNFDFTNGIGQSEGVFEDISIKGQLKDVKSVINHCLKYNQIDENRIAIVGHSLGGIIALLSKKELKCVKTTVSLSSPLNINKEVFLDFGAEQEDLNSWGRDNALRIGNSYFDKEYYLSYSFFEEINKINIKQLFKETDNHLLVQGVKDKLISLEDADLLYRKLGKPKKKVLIGNLTHFYKNKTAVSLVSKEIISWLKQFCK